MDWLQTDKGVAYRKRHNEYIKEWRKKNKDKFKATQKRAYDKIRMDALVHYSNDPPACECCGETEILFLHLDHINGNGAEHRRQMIADQGHVSGGNMLPYWLKKHGYPDGFQVLCANCNLGKRTAMNCPHKGK